MKKILIVYGSAGEGHKKAAFAVYDALRRLADKNYQITLIDSLDYTNAFFKFTYKMGYIFLVKYAPTIWGFFYYMLDNKFFFLLNQPLRIAANTLNTRKFVNFLKNEQFDLCVSTHFLSTEVITRMKRENKIKAKIINVITDFQSHRFWLRKNIDKHVVGSESTKQDLLSRNIDPGKINVFGIPIEEKFSQPKNKAEVAKILQLEEDKFTVLVMGGGFGVGPIKEVVMQVQKIDKDFQILVVCGHNKTLFNELNNLKSQFAKKTNILGFCDNMDEIMFFSDIMISKVGGMSSSESLACNLPIIAISPIPGQEMRNAKFLLNNGVGFSINKPKQAHDIVNNLLSDKEEFNAIKQKIAKIARPNSSMDTARLTLQELG